MSDPRLPEDGPDWPERDLEENRAQEPGAGWSDDPYRFEPLPPNKPSVEPLEGEWSDSEPFDSEPTEADPFAPVPTPPQDDAWGFPPRREPPYEPAATEPPFDSEPAWTDTPPEPEQPAAEQPAEAEQPSESEPMVAEEPPDDREPEPEPEPAEPEPMPAVDSEPDAEPEPEPDRTPQIAAAAVAAQALADQLAPSVPVSDPELEPESASEAEPEPDRTGEIAAAAIAAQAVADQLAPTPPPEEPEPEPQVGSVPEDPFEREYAPSDDVEVEAAVAATAFGGSPGSWDPKRDGNRRGPTTAEQAVPWLIGVILALAGIVIVLLALIFSSPNGLVASQPTGSEQPSASAAGVDPSSQPSGSGAASPSASGDETSAPTPSQPPPAFGPLEMTYLGRPSAVAPIYLLLRDFSETKDPDVLAQAEQGVSSYANSPDGRVSAAVINARAVALDRGGKARRLADNIRTLTFGWDAETLYAVRITRDGGNDLAKILEIDFASAATRQLATIRYPHPDTGAEAPVKEAQFIDDGGLVRLYAVADGNLTLWVLGAPATYRVDPANGDVTEIAREPILWSPDGTQRVTAHEDGNTTALRLRDRGNNVVASTGVSGLVSHIRWAPGNNEIVFTIGVTGASGGVRQDIYVWDLEDRNDPMPLTSSGAAFGAEWRGSMSNWGP